MEKEKAVNIIVSRDVFIRNYCTEKVWNIDTLSFEQILEIRSQDGWKNAGKDEK